MFIQRIFLESFVFHSSNILFVCLIALGTRHHVVCYRLIVYTNDTFNKAVHVL